LYCIGIFPPEITFISTQKIYFPSQQQPADVFFPTDLEAHCIGVFVFNLQSEGRSIEISAII